MAVLIVTEAVRSDSSSAAVKPGSWYKLPLGTTIKSPPSKVNRGTEGGVDGSVSCPGLVSAVGSVSDRIKNIPTANIAKISMPSRINGSFCFKIASLLSGT